MIAPLLAIACKRFPSLEKAIADGGYQGKATADDVQEQAGGPLEIVKRSDKAKGFYVLPKRWIAERTYGWLNRCRRLVKGYEILSRNHAAFIIPAMMPADAASNCKAPGRNIKYPDGPSKWSANATDLRLPLAAGPAGARPGNPCGGARL